MDIFNDLNVEFSEGEIPYVPVNIKVVGVGGAGNNMVSWLKKIGIKGAELIAINTDIQQLMKTSADKRIVIGKNTLKGLGCGGDPKKGELAARESLHEIRRALEGSDMVFICAGLGGGTGTGAAPVVAEIAKELGAIVIGVVTIPFKAEGLKRLEKAEYGLMRMRKSCNSVIVIDNNRLLKLAGNRPIREAFAIANNLIATTIRGITEMITVPQEIKNIDFADIKAIMESGGVCVVGIGESRSENRAAEAVRKALENPLLDVDYKGAKGALICIEAGENLTLEEADRVSNEVKKFLDVDCEVVTGIRVDKNMQDLMRIILLISGVKSPYILGPKQPEVTGNENKAKDIFERGDFIRLD